MTPLYDNWTWWYRTVTVWPDGGSTEWIYLVDPAAEGTTGTAAVHAEDEEES